MSTFTVALLQIEAAGNDQATNLARGEAACRKAKAAGADCALFPEMWNVGYTSLLPEDKKFTGPDSDLYRLPELWPDGPDLLRPLPPEQVWGDLAIGADNEFIVHFRQLARELDLAIALTYLETWEGGPRNTVSVIDRHGEIVLTYAKVHTCAFSVHEAAITPGDGFFVSTLDTAAGDVRIGAMICYDREFPESARCLMLGGAEIILVPNACDLEVNRLSQFRARAYENMVGMAMTNYPGPTCGHSIAYDGIGFKDGPRDMLLAEAGEGEAIVTAAFDLEALRDYRRRETWGNAFRRPSAYAALVAEDVSYPFVRVDADGVPLDRLPGGRARAGSGKIGM